MVDIQASLSKTQSNLSALLVDYGAASRTSAGERRRRRRTSPTRSCWGDSTATDSACYLEVTKRTTTPRAGASSKGILDSSNRDSLFTAGTLATVGQKYEFEWPTLPNDYTFPAGHQIGIVIGANFSGYGSVNGTTATKVTVDTKLSKVIAAGRRRRRGRADSGAFDAKPVAKIVTPPEGASLPARQAGERDLQVHGRVGIASCVGTVAERGADRHLDGGSAHVHGDRDRHRRERDDGDDALHGHGRQRLVALRPGSSDDGRPCGAVRASGLVDTPPSDTRESDSCRRKKFLGGGGT